jgi:hypothetical protein
MARRTERQPGPFLGSSMSEKDFMAKYCGSLAANDVEIIEIGNVEVSQGVLEMETRRIVEVED